MRQVLDERLADSVGLNELLGSPLDVSIQLRSGFAPRPDIQFQLSLVCDAPKHRINRGGDNCIVRQVDDDMQAHSAPVQ